MNLKRFCTRFREMRTCYVGTQVSFLDKIFYVVDYVGAFIVHGASISDYFAYGFYKLRYNGRKEYITYRRYHIIQDKCNVLSNRCLCREKNKFNELFKNFLGRAWIDVNDVTEEQFILFCNQHPILFVKETNGYRGIGTRKIETKKQDVKQIYADLVSDKGAHYIVEEQISQIQDLAEFHPWSINTIRIVTIYDTLNDQVHIMNARLRMGNKKNSVDNFHFEGIGANINIETGIIDTVGYDTHNNTYITHPLTGKQVIGFKIPYWEDCKSFVVKVAKNIPTVRYIGWDIVIQEGGNFVLIEGNDNADHDFQQLHNCGLWKQYKSIIKYF
ncbi:sugar-transfer associated ATP-grasp domain-containing protein [Bacteroides fluxus]|jgi:hypothetical protein|uniref:sugar-transfer associated ATP-grasp domain-containing protein n=1 Tax=Bacteroides fluxus TaxID=626930 RepID=UPI002A8213CF|nr:sugar-transfer associated ATP-grasp domain-containing protein [Bacteroides fluxus]MDY3788890.1 sugar-transfer associated ATP-grasp domain-containing protein [Bacteroides fluxus]